MSLASLFRISHRDAFRRDLRIKDNPALSAAARDGSVFAIFIWCPREEQQFYPGRDPIIRLPLCQLLQATGSVENCTIDKLSLEDDSEKPSNALLGRAWSLGWINDDKALIEFIENHLLDYANNRQTVTGKVPWSNERSLENKELNAIIDAWFTLWRY
ncbi:cryptochrome 2 [Tanacetum coccineum]